MLLHTALAITTLTLPVLSLRVPCTHDGALIVAKRPMYMFANQILERVNTETKGHFAFSPLLSWLQMDYILQGTIGDSRKEILTATGRLKETCYRRKLTQAIDTIIRHTNDLINLKTLIVLDKYMGIKKSFLMELNKSQSLKLLTLNFNERERCAAEVNYYISTVTNGVVKDIATEDDFLYAVYLMYGSFVYKSDWTMPFDSRETKVQKFYDDNNYPAGKVNMMTQIGVYNITKLDKFGLEVLELPCDINNRVSMLLILPDHDVKTVNLFTNLNRTRLAAIYNRFKEQGPRTVKLSLPRFKIRTDIPSLPAMYYDMGVKSIFYPKLANFKGISDYKMHLSVLKQSAQIEITEQGVHAISAGLLVDKEKGIKEFVLNRPFGFMLVERSTDTIMFAGVYSRPSVY